MFQSGAAAPHSKTQAFREFAWRAAYVLERASAPALWAGNVTRLFLHEVNPVLNANLGDPRHVGIIAFREFLRAAREKFLES